MSKVIAAVESHKLELGSAALLNIPPVYWSLLTMNHRTSRCQNVKMITGFKRTSNRNLLYQKEWKTGTGIEHSCLQQHYWESQNRRFGWKNNSRNSSFNWDPRPSGGSRKKENTGGGKLTACSRTPQSNWKNNSYIYIFRPVPLVATRLS